MRFFRKAKLHIKLIQLKAQYKSGNYSGHPEYMLGDIDSVEDRIKKL